LVINKFLAENYDPSLAMTLLRRARIYPEQREVRSSFIEGISSLELSIEEFLRHNTNIIQLGKSLDQSVIDSMEDFLQKGLRSQVVAIGISSGIVPMSDIESTIKAIDIRNKVVRDGFMPLLESSKAILMRLFRTISYLLSNSIPTIKFPSIAT
jgi:hypothetical protein